MRKLLNKITGRVSISLSDVLLLAGVGVVFYGVFCVYRPAAFILLGAGLIYYAIQIERGKNK